MRDAVARIFQDFCPISTGNGDHSKGHAADVSNSTVRRKPMLYKHLIGAIALSSLVAIATLASWTAGTPSTADAADKLDRLTTAQRDGNSGRARIPADVLNALIYEQVEAAMKLAADRDDSANDGPIPSHLELKLTCGGDYILIWWTNDDGSIGWDAECCDGEC